MTSTELDSDTLGELMLSVRSLIGVRTPPLFATHAVEAGEVRRFIHATMDDPARYENGSVPPAFPVHMFRRALTEPDPLAAMQDEDFDGVSRALRPGLPIIDAPFKRLLNGGYDYEFLRLARIGDRVYRISSYKDFTLRTGKSGPGIFVQVEDEYFTASDQPLLRAVGTVIMR